ncbi:MAG: LON peptidase substrate-binding domain-containing protein [Bdellovibrionales bacterium]
MIQTIPEIRSEVFPETVPLFTTSGAILLPHTTQSVNIYEEPYLHMIDEALGNGRYVGVIQPLIGTDEHAPLYHVGTLSKIISFAETGDGRYLLNLQGMCRFELLDSTLTAKNYRVGTIDASGYQDDLQLHHDLSFDREKLIKVLAGYFKGQGITADWGVIHNAASEELISSLAIICPLEPNEKQALLEAADFATRVELLITLLEMASLSMEDSETARH